MIEDTFTDTVTIKRSSPTMSGAYTQIVGPYSTSSTGSACRIAPLSGRLAQTVIGQYADASHMLYIDATTSIKPGDRVTDQDAKAYVVITVQKFKDKYEAHHQECVLAEIEVNT